jgi:methyl-accepting chemotaxis protein
MTVPISEMAEISTLFETISSDARDLIITQSAEDIEAHVQLIEDKKQKISKLSDQFSETIISNEMKQQFELFKSLRSDYASKLDKVIALAKENKDQEAFAILDENGEEGKAAKLEEATIQKIFEMKVQDAKTKADLNSKSANVTVTITVIAIIATICISILIGISIARLITKPLKKVVHMIEEMSKGHFKERLDIDTDDEVGQMAKAMNFFANDLQTNVIKAMDNISKGDMNIDINIKDEKDEISPALKKMVENIRALVVDANRISMAAIEGNLDERADVTRHSGDFKKIVDGINELMEAMVKPIKEVISGMSEISEGNLQISVNENYKGEFGVLAKSVNTTINSLNSVLSELNTASEQVLTGSNQVSDGSQALSQGATQQASAIEELNASITDVAGQTKENANNANQAKELALKVKENAEEGNRHMGEMLKSMSNINESSANISKIIKVIDEIAFQTNILALNAAVEAARAGQHGKGFAVVAEEVRNLAARSANAAKETTDLIEGSIKKIEKGTDITNDTAKALEQIVEGVSKAATLVAEIAALSNEQASSISQINLGVEQVSQVVQANSSTAEQSAAASEELSSQSELLKDMVSSFKLKNSNKSVGLRNETRNYKAKQTFGSENNKSYKEVAATKNKIKIALSDNEFGKY